MGSGVTLGATAQAVGAILNASGRQSGGLEAFRLRGLRLAALFGWSWTMLFVIMALGTPLFHPVTGIAYSALLNVTPALSVRARRYDFRTFLPASLTAALQPAVLLFLLQGQPSQGLAHLTFFVGLASLTLLCDWRPIALATLAVTLHLLFVGHALPLWVFPDGWSTLHVAIEALALALVAGVSSQMAVLTRRLIDEQDDAAEASAKAAVDAIAARRLAEESLGAVKRAEGEADAARAERDEAEAETRRARADALITLGRDYQQSVASIVSAVSAAATQLEASARAMNRIARTTGDQADDVLREAGVASQSAGQVSQAVGALSRSIAAIADASEQQSRLGAAARAQTEQGEAMLRALAERMANVGTFIDLIRGVANQTNLLALNATIEAARAGAAGRGFAVVAGEVKTLAGQAEDATQQVTQLVSTIGERAERADQALAAVGAAMGGLLANAESVEREIGSQRTTAQMIEQTAEDSASGVAAMARRCGAVAEAAREASQLSSEVEAAAVQLTTIAEQLQDATGRLVSELRAA